MRGLVCVSVLALAAGCFSGSKHATIIASGGATHGRAMLPATAEARTLYHVRYREVGGGPVTRAVLLGLLYPGTLNITTTETCKRAVVRNGREDCVQSAITIETEWSATQQEIDDFVPVQRAVMSRAMPIELDAVAYFDGGGDAPGGGGWRFGMHFRQPVGSHSDLAIGVQYERITFDDVRYRSVASRSPGVLVAQDVTNDVTYRSFAFPIRASTLVVRKLALFVQYDLNLLALGDERADRLSFSPVRAGVVAGGRVQVSIEGVSPLHDPRRASVLAEVGVAF